MRRKLKPQPDTDKINKLAAAINTDRVNATLLLQRGIADFDSAKAFFRPSLDLLHDPFLMKDMDKAVARIITAISNNEKILVFGDYDVDGTTAVACMYQFLKKIYSN